MPMRFVVTNSADGSSMASQTPVAVPTGSASAVLTPAKGLIAQHVIIGNSNASDRTVDLHFVDVNQSAANNNRIVTGLTVSANDLLNLRLGIVLASGQTIHAVASGSDVNVIFTVEVPA